MSEKRMHVLFLEDNHRSWLPSSALTMFTSKDQFKEAAAKAGSSKKGDFVPNKKYQAQFDSGLEFSEILLAQSDEERLETVLHRYNWTTITRLDISHSPVSNKKHINTKVVEEVVPNLDDAKLLEELQHFGVDVDLKDSEYFQNHPSMVKQLSKEYLQKINIDVVKRDPNLPMNWFIFETHRKGPKAKIDKSFITPDRKLIRSYNAVLEYMKASNHFTDEDIKNVIKSFRKGRNRFESV